MQELSCAHADADLIYIKTANERVLRTAVSDPVSPVFRATLLPRESPARFWELQFGLDFGFDQLVREATRGRVGSAAAIQLKLWLDLGQEKNLDFSHTANARKHARALAPDRPHATSAKRFLKHAVGATRGPSYLSRS